MRQDSRGKVLHKKVLHKVAAFEGDLKQWLLESAFLAKPFTNGGIVYYSLV